MQQLGEVRVVAADELAAFAERHGRADFIMVVAAVDLPQFGHFADADDALQRLQLLGDFEREVGAAGEQSGVGMALQ